MSGGKRQNRRSYERKLAKEAERQRRHADRYASPQTHDPDEHGLAEHSSQSEERDHERR